MTLERQVKVNSAQTKDNLSIWERRKQKETSSQTVWGDSFKNTVHPPICKWAPNDVCAAISLSVSAAQLLVFTWKCRLASSQSLPLTQRCVSTQIARNSYLPCSLSGAGVSARQRKQTGVISNGHYISLLTHFQAGYPITYISDIFKSKLQHLFHYLSQIIADSINIFFSYHRSLCYNIAYIYFLHYNAEEYTSRGLKCSPLNV